jgi:hypothetical protein
MKHTWLYMSSPLIQVRLEKCDRNTNNQMYLVKLCQSI